MTTIIYKDNDNLIELDQLKNSATDAYINDATVILVSIKDAAGVAVTGATFPLAMGYVTASNGKYQVTVDKLLALTAGRNYTAIVDAVSGSIDGHWELPLIAQVRTS